MEANAKRQQQPKWEYLKDFYTYALAFSSLAAGASATGSFNVQADSDFAVLKQTYFADIAAAAQTRANLVIPLVTVIIIDTGSGRQLMDSGVPIPSIFGTGEEPYILPTPKIFSARSTVQVTLTNFDAASTYNIRLMFTGTKIFKVMR